MLQIEFTAIGLIIVKFSTRSVYPPMIRPVKAEGSTLSPLSIWTRGPYPMWKVIEIDDESYWHQFDLNEENV
jgi:hypothetical protein